MKKKDYILILTLFIIGTLISSLVSVAATGNLFDSNEVTYDNTSSGMNSSNVKGALDELYAAATDYSTLAGKVQILEDRWINGNNLLKLKGSTGYTDRGITIYDNNDKKRGDFVLNTGTGTINVVSYNQSGTWGNFGNLSLYGDNITIGNTNNNASVKINNVDLTSISTGSCTINSTYTAKSTWGEISYIKLGKLVILNIYEIRPTGYTSQNEYEICTGLPPSASGNPKAVLSNTNGNDIYRVQVTTNGKLQWFYTNTGSTVASGQLIYVTN